LGLILDTSILIESERRGEGVEDILRRVRDAHGEIDVALSAVSAVELTHGIYRAGSDADIWSLCLICSALAKKIRPSTRTINKPGKVSSSARRWCLSGCPTDWRVRHLVGEGY
jgi:hypothetical protein